MIKKVFFLFCICFCSLITYAINKPIYSVEDTWIVGHNLKNFNNRPLYINNTNGFILAGDKPVMRLCRGGEIYGTLSFNFMDMSGTYQLHEFSEIKSMYKNGHMKWVIEDNRKVGLQIQLEVVPDVEEMGMVVKVKIKGAKSEDQLSWTWNGQETRNENLSWKLDCLAYPEVLSWGPDFGTKTLTSGVIVGNKTVYLFASDKRQMLQDMIAKRKFETGLKKMEDLCNRMIINTPDVYLNALAMASVRAVDGCWYPPVFAHGAMQWNNNLPGWRVLFGGTMYGWHDRIAEEAKHYISTQVTKSDYKENKPNKNHMWTLQDYTSRFYGEGRILADQNAYDMQSQFFDQLIEDYRWNDDPTFIALLRPALELHLKWIEECFDPDGDGCYESYLNTWPTDSQWYNGGGTAEETAYAYRGHQAAYDMAKNAGDTKSMEHHDAMLKRIKNGFQNILWLKDQGFSASYIEQEGNKRLHKNPWLYSIFLPIDAQLTSSLQNIESLYYTEWALQNDKMPCGGRMIWTSNWVPGIWSVRPLWPGDNYHLAQAYFTSDLPDEGYDILKGTFMHGAYNTAVPGNIGDAIGGTDFGDCIHTFCRTLVGGMFGFLPDYPNQIVRISPKFPTDWDYASLSLPDFSINFQERGLVSEYEIRLKKAAKQLWEIPVKTSKVVKVTLNGKNVSYTMVPGVSRSILNVEVPLSYKSVLNIYTAKDLDYKPCQNVQLSSYTQDKITIDCDSILAVYDPQNIFENIQIKNKNISVWVANNTGFHTAVCKVMRGENEEWKILRVNIRNEHEEKMEKLRTLEGYPQAAIWEKINLQKYMNADVTQIFKQEYLSPRPNTASCRLGIDGFSTWTFPYWNAGPPEIKLDSLNLYLQDETLKTPQGVQFQWPQGENNIIFTSMWDNYPTKIAVDINTTGEALCFLVCGSTNVMQCDIANAVLRIYYEDGSKDQLELIPPINYWNLCAFNVHGTAAGQGSRAYYTSEIDRFCMPQKLPDTIRLGKECTAMVLNRVLKPGVVVERVELETLSQEVVVGLMGVSILK